MAVIKAGSSQFPFHITDVAALLRLNIRRRGPDFLYVDCPLCGDHRGKLYLKTSRDVWHCNYCQESGGMLALYAKVYGISNADAYREICEALQTGDYAPEYQSYQNRQPQEIVQSARASRQAIHQTLSMLFSMLSLTPKHRAHLREVRGLTDEQIERFGFKSTPPPYLCKSLTARLLKQGCVVQGVPGFYLAEDGRWTVRFGTRTAGILIPARSADGLVCGAQIRLDTPIREENAPADKEGTKYLWLSSSSKPMGTSSESPIHFVGDPCSRVVYVTEGLLKADICHALMNRTFAATAGANNVSKLDELFAFLKKNGTEEVIEAQDMDKYRNVHVEKGASKIYLMARKHGLQCRRLTWNPNYKGLDDWQLALRKNAAKGTKTMTFRERYLYGACAFSEIDACVEQWHKTQPDGDDLFDQRLDILLRLLLARFQTFNIQPSGRPWAGVRMGAADHYMVTVQNMLCFQSAANFCRVLLGEEQQIQRDHRHRFAVVFQIHTRRVQRVVCAGVVSRIMRIARKLKSFFGRDVRPCHSCFQHCLSLYSETCWNVPSSMTFLT